MFGAALDYPADKARDKQPHELQTEQRLKAMIENPEIMENPDHPEYMQLVTDDRRSSIRSISIIQAVSHQAELAARPITAVG
jgi:hypothetical protein